MNLALVATSTYRDLPTTALRSTIYSSLQTLTLTRRVIAITMAYTKMCMQAILPEAGTLPSIGSVSGSISSTEYSDFLCSTFEAESVNELVDVNARHSYIESLCGGQTAVKKTKSVRKKRPGEKRRLKAKLLRLFAKIKEAYTS